MFKECRLSTTSGSDLEHNKFVGQVSTIMRCLTNKDSDLLSQFDKIKEKVVLDNVGNVDDNPTSINIRDTSLHEMLSLIHI